MTHSVAILGASGYTGAELIRLIAEHPSIEIKALGAFSKAGQKLAEVFPHLRHLDLPDMVAFDTIDWTGIDLCFCALPHKTSQEVIRDLPKTLKIVDLSADFRLLAGTGCNAATGQFALRPLIAAGVIGLDDIIMDLKCAVSGAGRSLKENLLHAELSEGYHAYALGGTHRHLGEFDQEFSKVAGRPVQVQFTPHLIPANRGILATCYVSGDADAVHGALAAAYENEPFIQVLPQGEAPSTRHIRGSNFCHIGVVADRIAGRCIVVAALDNLTKGSSGQALQNANLMLGLPETAGLMMAPLFP